MSSSPVAAAPVAVVGLACRFPGGPDVETFWKLLLDGGNAIDDIDPRRWNLDALRLQNDGKPVPRHVTRGGWLKRVQDFDNTFFRMSPREAKVCDPKQRLALEVTYEAFEDANLSPDQIRDQSTGVFIGCAQSEYLQRFFWRGEIGGSKTERYSGPGNDPSVTSGRVSGVLGFEGPSVNVNTACSTSLVAIHQAIKSIQNGECDVAVAGGVAIIQSPEHSLTMDQFGVLAPDSQCKAFSNAADGYVRAEGCGMVVLRRLDDAIAHGDRIYAVIRGSAVNHNGPTDNLMAPEVEAQVRLLNTALKIGGIEAESVDYIEAHGTGTKVGDPIEVEALGAVFAANRQRPPAYVASVKTNVGHLEVAAGVAGFIKAALCVYHKKMPAHLHLTELNPDIDAGLPFIYPKTTTDWVTPNGRPRRAVVNSFGISGINAAVVMEEAPAAKAPALPALPRPSNLLVLSAYGDKALRQLAASYADALEKGNATDIAFTAATGRNSFPARLAVVVERGATAAKALRTWSETSAEPTIKAGEVRGDPPKTALLFTGQGAQHVGMGKDVYAAEPAFREVIDRCDALFAPLLGRSLRAVMFGEDTAVSIDDTQWTQPALFSYELAMAALWRTWGVEPSVVVGHSVGEIAAAVVAGVFTLQDAVQLVAARGRLMSALPREGAMRAIFADVETVRAALQPYAATVSIASDNGATSTVISGKTEDVLAVAAVFEAKEIGVRAVNTSHAFHSPLMDPMLEAFRAVAAKIPMAAPKITLLSNVTGEALRAEDLSADYWVRHVRGAVRFREDVLGLKAAGVGLVVEVGPEPTLAGMGRRVVPDAKIAWVASSRKDRPWQTLLEGVSDAWLAGAPVRWAGFWSQHRAQRVNLPRYPFQRRELWVEDPGPAGVVERLGGAVAGPVGQVGPTFQAAEHYRLRWLPISGFESRQVARGTFIVGLDRRGAMETTARALEAAGHTVVRVVPALQTGLIGDGKVLGINPGDPTAYRELVARHAGDLRAWVNGWPLDVANDDARTGAQWTETAEVTSLAHMFIAQAVVGGGNGAGIALVTRGADAVVPGEAPQLGQIGAWGVARVVSLEHRALPNWRFDLDPTRPDAGGDELARLLLAPPANEDQLALRRGGLFALRLAPHRPSGTGFRARPDGAWLVTGGLGGLGLAVAQWLVQHGVTRLILCGRSAPSAEAQAAIAALEAAGATVLVEAVDVGNATHVQNLFRYVAKKGVAIRGVVHSAGLLADAPVLRQDRNRFYQVFPSKVEGAWNLHKATENLDLDAFILFSSVTSTLGAPGQVNYAAANAFLDGLSWYRVSRGLPSVTINWGPWGEVGMAAKLAALMESRGMAGLKTAPALAAMGEVSADLAPQVTFMDMRARDILAREPGFQHAPLMREVMRIMLGEAAVAAPVQRVAVPPVEAKRPVEAPVAAPVVKGDPREALLAWLQRAGESMLGFGPGELDPNRPLSWQGFDSVMALDLQKKIKTELGVDLAIDHITSGPKLTELRDQLMPQVRADRLGVLLGTKPAASAAMDAPPVRNVASSVAPMPPKAAPAAAAAPTDVLAWLQRTTEGLLGFAAGELDPNRPLSWQGFDSVMALDLQKQIKTGLGVDVAMDLIANGPKLTEIRDAVAPKVKALNSAAPAPQVTPQVVVATPAPTPAPAGRPTDVLAWLQRTAEGLLGFAAGELDANRPLSWQGFDSVMALDLQKQIKTGLGVDIAMDLLANGPKLTEIRDAIAPKVAALPAAPAVATAPAVAAAAPAAAPGRPTDVLAWLVTTTEGLLGFSAGELDPKRPLSWQGFDSVMALDLQKRIKTDLGVTLPMDRLANGPALTELVPDLSAAVLPASSAPAAAPAASTTTAWSAAQAPAPAAPAAPTEAAPAWAEHVWQPVSNNGMTAPPASPAGLPVPASDAVVAEAEGNPVLWMVAGLVVAILVVGWVASTFAQKPTHAGAGAENAAGVTAPAEAGGHKGGKGGKKAGAAAPAEAPAEGE